jgi:hypothetical protein
VLSSESLLNVRIFSLGVFYLLYDYHWWAASPLLAANEDKKNGAAPKRNRAVIWTKRKK